MTTLATSYEPEGEPVPFETIPVGFLDAFAEMKSELLRLSFVHSIRLLSVGKDVPILWTGEGDTRRVYRFKIEVMEVEPNGKFDLVQSYCYVSNFSVEKLYLERKGL